MALHDSLWAPGHSLFYCIDCQTVISAAVLSTNGVWISVGMHPSINTSVF